MRRAALLSVLLLTAAGQAQVKQFSVETVAGSDNDVMIVRHLVIKGSNQAIGQRLAELAKAQHHTPLGKWPNPEAREKATGWFQANYPQRMERAKGVAMSYGVPPTGDYDVTSLPIDLAFEPGCSVVYYPGSSVTTGHAMLSRNYDFPKASYSQLTGRKTGSDRSMTGDPYVIEMYPDKGYPSLFTCAYDLVGGAVDGVNSKGVCVALLADDMSKSRSRGNGFGLSEVDLPRFVLDRAASAKEARELLKDAPYYSTFVPCHYIIGDASGDSFIFEVAADGKHYLLDGGKKPQIITNHSIAEYGTGNLPEGDSFNRYRMLQAQLAQHPGKVTPAQVKEINYCVAVPKGVQVAATMWHAVYDLKDRSMIVSFCLSRADEKEERRSPYLSFKLRP